MSTCCACSNPPTAATRGAGEWTRLAIAALVAGQSMIFSLAVNLSPPDPSSRWVIHGVLAASAVAVFLLAGLPILREAWDAARHGRIVIDQLFLAGIAAAFGVSVHSTLTGYGSIYYEVVAILVAISMFGKLVGERRRQAALEAAKALGREFETCERLTCCGSTETVNASTIEAGDRLVVRAGSPVPADGIVLEGTAFVRETALTGEPFPVVKRTGDRVFAGGYSLDGMLTIEATVAGNERRLDGILDTVREAQSRPSRLQREADSLVAWFLPSVLTVSAATFAFWTWRESWIVGVFNGLAVVLVACPCSMGLATPVGIWSALAALAKRGIVPRDGDLVEKLSQVDTVVFDKTGTLGEEELERVDFVEAPGIDRQRLLNAVARLEASSTHPVARAFRMAGAMPVPVNLLVGAGLEGVVDGVSYRIGNQSLLSTSQQPLADSLASTLKGEAAHLVYIIADGSIAGIAALREKLREGALTTLEELGRLGLLCEIMTGDRPEAAAAHGLPNVHAGLAPADKTRLVKNLESSGRRVLFVGDGVNDAPAMSEASAALAIGSGSALARETATGEVASSDLSAVPFAVARCRKAVQAIHTNIRIAAFYNIIGISLAACGIIHPVLAAVLMLVSSFTVTWRALAQTGNAARPISKPMLPAVPWRLIIPSATLALQGPFIVYLGGFQGVAAYGFLALFLATGALCWLALLRRPITKLAEMTLGMFSLGGLAMLLGWWADAGFAAVVRNGVCLCGCADSTMGLGIFAKLNWMDASMVLASLQMVAFERRGRGRLLCWVAGLFGMLAGMEAAAWVMSHIVPTLPGMQFFATYAAMMLGMSVGMVSVCASLQQLRKEHV
jgi:Cu2+-exporting ATPase/Cu+-exporting ATPase